MIGRIAASIQWTAGLPFLALFSRLFKPSSGGEASVLLLASYVAGFVLKWAVVGLILSLAAPGLLPGASAVGTVSEVLPALMVSVFVFVLGSFFVVTQLGTTIHTNRASLLLIYDGQVQQSVVRPLLIALSTLLLALLRPGGEVSDPLAAFAVVLIAATAFTLLGSAALLPSMISRVTAPRNFELWLVGPVAGYLSVGFTEDVVWRVGALGEMLRRGVRSGDSLQLDVALSGFQDFHRAYVEASEVNPHARTHSYDQSAATGWLAEELVPALVSAGQEAIALDIANRDANAIANTLAAFGGRSAEAGHREEYVRAVDGLGELATCTQQMKIPGLANHMAEPVYGLGVLVEKGRNGLDQDAARALATWALTVAYAMRHLGGNLTAPRHPQWTRSLARIGSNAPFQAAHDVVDSEAFRAMWANKGIPPELDFSTDPPTETRRGGLDAVHDFLDDAAAEAP